MLSLLIAEIYTIYISVYLLESLLNRLKFLKLDVCYLGPKYCFMMMLFELLLLRKISEFPSGTRTHNLLIAGETL